MSFATGPLASRWYARAAVVQEAEQRAIDAAEWVARGLPEPSPDPRDFIASVRRGLVQLGDPWTVTEHGRAILRRRGRP